MFSHRESRSLVHNLRLASLLSFVAGTVNACGFLSLGYLTTNVTGHFAAFGITFLSDSYRFALTALAFVMAFFFGAFFSSLLMEIRAKADGKLVGILPVTIESFILIWIAFLPEEVFDKNTIGISMLLLFVMGMQNAVVTGISHSIVRTTHLTGLFTDLGIELAQLFFYIRRKEQKKLYSSIKLHVSVIAFFLLGLVVGAWLFMDFSHKTLLLAAALLIIGMLYERIKLNVVKLKDKINGK